MFDVGRSKKCFNLPLTSIFSRRNGRTFLGPPLEAVGLDQTNGRGTGFRDVYASSSRALVENLERSV